MDGVTEEREGSVTDVKSNEGDEKNDDDEVINDAEGREPKLPQDPGQPTQREIDEHNISHHPFRSWCPYCCMGKAVASPRRTSQSRDADIKATGPPTVSFDYCWADGKAEQDNEDDRENGEKSGAPVLIMYVDATDSMFTISVKRKGPIPWVVSYIVSKLETIGYGGMKVTVKSDGEPAILALVSAVAVARKAETPLIQSPKRESKCNGAVERAVRTWRAQLITMRCHLEAEIKFELRPKQAIMEWLIMWASEVRNYFRVGSSGRTSYELITGHRFPATVGIFGEKMMFMVTPPKQGRNKWKPVYTPGIFLGVQGRTGESIFHDDHGIHRARNVRRLPRDDRWDKDSVNKVNVGVAEYVTGDPQDPVTVVVQRPPEPLAPAPEPRVPIPRRVRLGKSDFEKHGYTAGCPGCIHYATEGSARAGHNEACRARMEKLMSETEEGAAKLESNKFKLDAHVAREGEQLMADQQEQRENADSSNMDGDPSSSRGHRGCNGDHHGDQNRN